MELAGGQCEILTGFTTDSGMRAVLDRVGVLRDFEQGFRTAGFGVVAGSAALAIVAGTAGLTIAVTGSGATAATVVTIGGGGGLMGAAFGAGTTGLGYATFAIGAGSIAAPAGVFVGAAAGVGLVIASAIAASNVRDQINNPGVYRDFPPVDASLLEPFQELVDEEPAPNAVRVVRQIPFGAFVIFNGVTYTVTRQPTEPLTVDAVPRNIEGSAVFATRTFNVPWTYHGPQDLERVDQ